MNFKYREATMNNYLAALGKTPYLKLKGFIPMHTISYKYKHLQCLAYAKERNEIAGIFCIWGGAKDGDTNAIIAIFDAITWKMKKWKKTILHHGNDLTWDSKRKIWVVSDVRPGYNYVTIVNTNLDVIREVNVNFQQYAICYNSDKDEYAFVGNGRIVITDPQFKKRRDINMADDPNRYQFQTIEYADGFYFLNYDHRIHVYLDSAERIVKMLDFQPCYEHEGLCYLGNGEFILNTVSNISEDHIALAHLYTMNVQKNDDGEDIISGKIINGLTIENIYYRNKVYIENNQINLSCAERFKGTSKYSNNSNNPLNITKKIYGRDANPLQNIKVVDNGRCLIINSVFDTLISDSGQLQTEKIFLGWEAKRRGITTRTSFSKNGYCIRLYKNGNNINMRNENGIEFEFSLRFGKKALTTVVK